MSKLLEARQRADAAHAEASRLWALVLAARATLAAAEIPEGKTLSDLPELKASEDAMAAFKAASDEATKADAEVARLANAMGENDATPAVRIVSEASLVRGDQPHVDLGHAFVESSVLEQVRAANPSGSGRIGTTTSATIASREQVRAAITLPVGDTVVAPDQQPGIRALPLPAAQLTILDLISLMTTDSEQVKWVIESAFTNAADTRARGAAAAESGITLDTVKYDVESISHWLPAARELFDDVAGLQSLVNTKMVYGLRRKLASKVYAGVHTTTGLAHVDGNGVTAEALISDIFDAQQTVFDRFGEMPTATFVSSADYKTLRFAREGTAGAGTATGGYLFGPPNENNPIDIDGVRVLKNADAVGGNPITGVWREYGVWLRDGMAVSASDSHEDFFIKRMIAVFAEFRAAMGAMSALAFCEVVQP